MNTQTQNYNKTTIIKSLILLFFLLSIPITLIYLFLIAPYQQSISVTFGDKKVKNTEYVSVESLKGYSLVLNSYEYSTYEYEDDDDLEGKPYRQYSGYINLIKDKDNPIEASSASVSIVLKAKYEGKDVTLARKDNFNVTIRDNTSTATGSFTIDYYNNLPYRKMFKKYDHPIMYIQIKFAKTTTDKLGNSIDISEYVYLKLDPKQFPQYAPSVKAL